jgi:hypothetical protein
VTRMPVGSGTVDDMREEARGGFSPRAALVLLCALLVVDFADRQVVVAAFPYLRAEWALREVQLGALVSAVSVVVALGTFPVAFGRPRVFRIAVMGPDYAAICRLRCSS